MDALEVLQGKRAVFFPRNNGREGMIVNAVALAISVLGRTVLAVRLPTALASAGTVFAVFWLGRVLFGRDERFDGAPRRGATEQDTPWRGLLIGGVGAGLLAVSLNQTLMGRTALRGNFLPLVLCLCLALLWRGWQERSWPRVALAGACAGLLAYTYIAARFTPLVFLLFGLSFALPLRSVTWTRVRAASLKRNLPWVVIFLGVAGLVAAPMLLYFAQHPGDFFVRGSQLSVFDPSVSQGDPLGSLLFNVREHLLVLGFRSDPNWNRSFGQPMLNPWEAFFFWLGVGMAVWRWQQRPPYRLLLIWLVALIPAGHAGQRSGIAASNSRPQHFTHDRRGAGCLSAHRRRRVGSVALSEGAMLRLTWACRSDLPGKPNRGCHCGGRLGQRRSSGSGRDHLSHLFPGVGEYARTLQDIRGGVDRSGSGPERATVRGGHGLPDPQFLRALHF